MKDFCAHRSRSGLVVQSSLRSYRIAGSRPYSNKGPQWLCGTVFATKLQDRKFKTLFEQGVPVGIVIRLQDQRGPCSRPDSTKYPPCLWHGCWFNLTSRVKCHPAGVAWIIVEGVPAQKSFSLSVQSSKSTNRHCVDSKRDFNRSKLN
ncbi:hypothetical protein AVEN_260709-1 [Araneus ventricosus]|uniref:Uncharacterized protein n=1 Tax=Araneus ventricosus TaxID=182803 RepID=A0A4Y2P6Z6_ARAVE|nr:hypothetical protein AVEN_260709-1 [Araneus ventricosus]